VPHASACVRVRRPPAGSSSIATTAARPRECTAAPEGRRRAQSRRSARHRLRCGARERRFGVAAAHQLGAEYAGISPARGRAAGLVLLDHDDVGLKSLATGQFLDIASVRFPAWPRSIPGAGAAAQAGGYVRNPRRHPDCGRSPRALPSAHLETHHAARIVRAARAEASEYPAMTGASMRARRASAAAADCRCCRLRRRDDRGMASTAPRSCSAPRWPRHSRPSRTPQSDAGRAMAAQARLFQSSANQPSADFGRSAARAPGPWREPCIVGIEHEQASEHHRRDGELDVASPPDRRCRIRRNDLSSRWSPPPRRPRNCHPRRRMPPRAVSSTAAWARASAAPAGPQAE